MTSTDRPSPQAHQTHGEGSDGGPGVTRYGGRPAPAAYLTAADKHLLVLVATGHTHHAIARIIHSTERATAMALHRLYRRIGARNAPHAVTIALRRNLIDPVHVDAQLRAERR